MAGKGPSPKPAHLRQRTNKKSTAATLEAPEKPDKRPLPKTAGRAWSKATRDWWARVWNSPMAGEFLDTDADSLGRLAILVDDFHLAEEPKTRMELMKEIRLQEARFGLSPVDRARLHWEVARGDDAEQKRQRRRPQKPAETPSEPAADPRAALRVVK